MGEGALFAKINADVLRKAQVFPEWCRRFPFPDTGETKIDGYHHQKRRDNPEKTF